MFGLHITKLIRYLWDIKCGIAKQPPTKAKKNFKTLSPRKDYVSLTTILIHIYILGMDFIQLLILLLLIHLFFQISHGSDHFPFILESLNSTVGEILTRYKFDKADWSLYEQVCKEKLQTEIIRNATDSILKFNETVISIADATIPKTSKNPKHPGKQWLNDDCKDAIKNRKKAKRHRTTSAISPSSGRKLEEH